MGRTCSFTLVTIHNAPQSRLHVEGSEALLPPHPLPAPLRLCGKLSVLDELLTRLHAARHKARCWGENPTYHSTLN